MINYCRPTKAAPHCLRVYSTQYKTHQLFESRTTALSNTVQSLWALQSRV